jgi:hypothetical protein
MLFFRLIGRIPGIGLSDKHQGKGDGFILKKAQRGEAIKMG